MEEKGRFFGTFFSLPERRGREEEGGEVLKMGKRDFVVVFFGIFLYPGEILGNRRFGAS